MLTIKEKAINNTFQIKEDFKVFEDCKRSFYYSLPKSRPSPRAQLPEKVRIFTEGEVFLFQVKKYKQALI